MQGLGIDTRGLRFTDQARTTLAFVSLDAHGERSFSFYRKPGADTTLSYREVDRVMLRHTKVFHFGSLSLTDQPSRQATFKAVQSARRSGCLVSYDPNLRPMLWRSESEALKRIRQGLRFPHILKISEEELLFLTGESELVPGSAKLFQEYQIPIILVTLGSKGCFYRFGNLTGWQPAFTDLKTIDTTGAGDAFLGGFLFALLLRYGVNDLRQFNQSLLENSITFANATAALCTTGRGAIPAMPNLQAVQDLIEGDCRV